MSLATPPPSGLAVTGSTGRIGRMLRRTSANADVVWLTRSDALDPAFLGRDSVLALAGVTRGPLVDLAQNTVTALAALAAAQRSGVRRVFVFSSAAVYGRAQPPLSEALPPTPAGAYGAAKAQMEAAVTDWASQHLNDPEVVILRLGNVAGADALLSELNDDIPALDVFADGTSPRRSYIGPVTLADTLARLLAYPASLPPILNLACPQAVSMGDLLDAADRDWTPQQAPDSAIAEVQLDTTLLQSLVPINADAGHAGRIVAEWREVCG